MGLKVAVVGGGSTYTPELVEGLAARSAELPIDELVLFDIDAERLEVVGALAGRILRRLDWGGRLVCTTDRTAAIDAASFVLVQLRVGGQAARRLDETLPLRFERSARRRRVPAASPRRCGPCPWSSTWPRRSHGDRRPTPG